MAKAKELRVGVGETGEVSALYLRPRGATHLYLLAHGAGAGMRHPFLETVAQGLAERKIATFRYQFPYMEQGKKAPSRQPVLRATVRAAAAAATRAGRALPLVAGGKSMGGRMTSLAMAAEPIPGVDGLVFLGFPLHAPGRDGAERGAHLREVSVPMLFLQGDRDKLANLDHLRPLVRTLGRRARLHVVADGDHSFHVRKSSGRDDAAAMEELLDAATEWMRRL